MYYDYRQNHFDGAWYCSGDLLIVQAFIQ